MGRLDAVAVGDRQNPDRSRNARRRTDGYQVGLGERIRDSKTDHHHNVDVVDDHRATDDLDDDNDNHDSADVDLHHDLDDLDVYIEHHVDAIVNDINTDDCAVANDNLALTSDQSR